MKVFSQLRTSKKLGWRNCAAVAAHRCAHLLLSASVAAIAVRCRSRSTGCDQPAPFHLSLGSRNPSIAVWQVPMTSGGHGYLV